MSKKFISRKNNLQHGGEGKNQFASRPFAPAPTPEVQAKSEPKNPEPNQTPEEIPSSDRLSRIEITPPNPIQPKLTIGAPGDKYEREADTVARKVVSQMNSPSLRAPQPEQTSVGESIQPKISILPKSTLQRRETEAPRDVESSIQQARGSGQPISPTIRQPMERAFGADFSSVRIHANSQSDRLNQSIQAKAFTTGQDIFFRQGEYQPESQGGKELLAHELTHVVQQGGSTVQQKTEPKIQRNEPTTSTRNKEILNETITQFTKLCREWKDTVNGILNNMARDTGGKLVFADVKADERIFLKAQTKIIHENKTDITNVIKDIKDVLRSSIVYSTFEKLSEGYLKIINTMDSWKMIDRIIKVESTFEKGQQKKSGYRDAKLVFGIKPPGWEKDKNNRPFLCTHLADFIPVEVQFHVGVGLVVKEGALYDQAEPDYDEKTKTVPEEKRKWSFIEVSGDTKKFKAKEFLEKIIARCNEKMMNENTEASDKNYVARLETVRKKAQDLIKELPTDTTLPLDHYLYEQKQAWEAYKNSKDPNKQKPAIPENDIDKYYELYKKLYEVAYEYSNWNEEKGNELSKVLKNMTEGPKILAVLQRGGFPKKKPTH